MVRGERLDDELSLAGVCRADFTCSITIIRGPRSALPTVQLSAAMVSWVQKNCRNVKGEGMGYQEGEASGCCTFNSSL